MARTKGARKKGRTKRIGTKRMRYTSMKKGDKRKLGRRSSRRSRRGTKRSLRGARRSMRMRGGEGLRVRPGNMKARLWRERLTAEKNAIDIMDRANSERAAAERAAAEIAAERAAAERAADEKIQSKLREDMTMAKQKFNEFKDELFDKILYDSEEGYEEGDLGLVPDDYIKRVKNLLIEYGLVRIDFSQLDMLQREFGPESTDSVLISEIKGMGFA